MSLRDKIPSNVEAISGEIASVASLPRNDVLRRSSTAAMPHVLGALIPRRLSDFDYSLPKARVAQFAPEERTSARLMVIDRSTAAVQHKQFSDLADYFNAGDVLVLNDTKVMPARLFARRKTGGRVELLLLKELAADRGEWEVLVRPSGRVRVGEHIHVGTDHELAAELLSESDYGTGIRRVRFHSKSSVKEMLAQFGRIPLPPYIDREDTTADRELYQTVFAKHLGAVASPTAGLHFSKGLLEQLTLKGVEVLCVTLHVGYGTFQPVTAEDLSRHRMYQEQFEVSSLTAERVNRAKREGRPITACGTTVVRTLESAVGANPCAVWSSAGWALVRTVLRGWRGVRPRTVGQTRGSVPTYRINPIRGTTNLFIYPPYTFKVPDRLITNFHLPKSTLLMLTSAFAGHELLMRAYREAIQEKYRFYSYGDAMLIL